MLKKSILSSVLIITAAPGASSCRKTEKKDTLLEFASLFLAAQSAECRAKTARLQNGKIFSTVFESAGDCGIL